MDIIIGEVFSVLAALTLAYSTFSNKKNKMMWLQAINAVFYGLSNLFLGGYSAVVTNVLTFLRNVLVAKDRLDGKTTAIICILMVIVGVYFNNMAWRGLLPVIASVQYTLCVYILKSAQHMRIALVVNLLQWVVFDFSVKAYPMFALDIIITVIALINFLRFRNRGEEGFRNKI